MVHSGANGAVGLSTGRSLEMDAGQSFTAMHPNVILRVRARGRWTRLQADDVAIECDAPLEIRSTDVDVAKTDHDNPYNVRQNT